MLKLKNILRLSLIALAAAAFWSHADTGGEARAADNGWPQSNQDLFYNFYAHPGPAGGVTAPMYVSPIPTPPYVGHTWITYQPFMPHHYMFPHKRVYTKWHYEQDGTTLRSGGRTVTKVRWY